MLIAALSLGACEGDGATLVIDVKTDLVPGVELIAIRTELDAPRTRVDQVVFRGDDAASGIRAAELAGLADGDHVVDVSLLDAAMRVVLRRRVRVVVRGPTGVTLLFTRTCRDVVCPRTGEDTTLTECVGGACADPSCSVEVRATCPPAECTSDDACTFAASCARGACVDGFCLATSSAGACASNEYCHPDLGCLALPDPIPDAGPRDAGAVDGGACCGFAMCRADCTACGTCGDASEGAFEPTADRMLAGGAHYFSSVTVPAGVTVRGAGPTPLQIFSTGPVRIDGTLDISGVAGRDSICVYMPQVGGIGVAGGGNGGNSGQAMGMPGQGPGAGGAGTQGDAGGGGGGAGSRVAGMPGANDSIGAAGGASGPPYDAFAGAAFEAGSGGGGAGQGAAGNASGGGGGAGGGAVLIIAPEITIGATGGIRAAGGAGGGGGGAGGRACAGGGGGGGSGGSVWLRGSVVAIDGAIDVAGGLGGVTGLDPRGDVPGAGGTGGEGQIRVDALEISGTTTPELIARLPVCDGPPCD